jgi:hypothetical protein
MRGQEEKDKHSNDSDLMRTPACSGSGAVMMLLQ